MLYFDNASTAMLHPVLKEHLSEELMRWQANPSSFHKAGMEVQKRITQVKELMAEQIKGTAQELYFTSGGTECNNMVLRGILCEGDHVITSAIEHPSIRTLLSELEPKVEVTRLKEVSEQTILQAIRPNTRLVTLMHVNNETGQILQVGEVYKQLKQKGILLHRDAVQSLLKVPFDIRQCDLASFSAHKIGAFKGLGILYKRKSVRLKPLLYGGEQQHSLRPGTENVPAILALGLVLQARTASASSDREHVQQLNLYIQKALQEHCIILSDAQASPYILSLSVPGIPSEILLNALSEREIYVSAGSACSSHSQHISYVIEQLVEDERIRKGVLRISFSEQNTMKEAEHFVAELLPIIQQLRKVIR